VQLIAPDGTTGRAASAPVLTFETLTQPGWYRVVEQGDAGRVFEGRVAVNAGSMIESNLRRQPLPTLLDSDPAREGEPEQRALDLWPWLALAALAVLALEWGYVHFRRA
jgi:hypothetical protein